MTKFYEKNSETMAMRIWMKAYPEIQHQNAVFETYSQVDKMINSLPMVDSGKYFDQYYSFNRLAINQKIIKSLSNSNRESNV